MSSASIPRRSTPSSADPPVGGSLAGLAGLFLRLGLIAFGGPAAHVALMREEFVRRRGWLDDETFVDLVGAANLIPGPTSTELAMHIGHRRAGWPGLVVAGLAFLAPAVAIVGVMAWLYVDHGTRPEIGAVLDGVGPVVVAVIAHAGWSLGRTVVRTGRALMLLGTAVVAVAAGVPEIVVLLGGGVVGWVLGRPRLRGGGPGVVEAVRALALAVPSVPGAAALAAPVVTAVTPFGILVTFLKVGAVLFGSGYVLVALLRSELVDGLGWLTEQQLLDAVAVGQATPGPLFSTATFIGYVLGGPLGAGVGTVGVFLPAFLAVALSIPLLERLRRSQGARAALDGVNLAAIALLGVVAAELAIGTMRDLTDLVVGIAALVLLVRGVPSVWLIAAGAAIGVSRLWAPWI